MIFPRSTLAKVDSRIRAQLDHEEGVQLVKVPVSEAMWSTWRRYCELAEISMGRGLAVLLALELAAVVDEDLEGLATSIRQREAAVADREKAVTELEAEVSRRQTEVEVEERRLQHEASRLAKASRPVAEPHPMGEASLVSVVRARSSNTAMGGHEA